MEQSSKLAVMKDVPTTPRMEESVVGMERRKFVNLAATRDVTTKSRREESASVMEQRLKYAVMKDAPIMSRKEACAKGMELISETIIMRICV